ncbi:MAG: four helix bundle protein [Vicingaceae bacterium]
MYKYSFEKLNAFHNARRLTNLIYDLNESFPKTGLYSVSAQSKRAAVSVMANLVEGISRMSNKDKAHFTTIAFSSLME